MPVDIDGRFIVLETPTESFARHITGICNRLNKVGFSQSRSAVDEKGVVGARGVVCNGERRGVVRYYYYNKNFSKLKGLTALLWQKRGISTFYTIP